MIPQGKHFLLLFLSIHFTLNLQYTERVFKMNDQCPFSSQPFKLEEGWSSKSYMATKLVPMKVISPFWEAINQLSLTGHHGGLWTPLHSEKAVGDRWPIVVLRTVFPPSTMGFLQKKKIWWEYLLCWELKVSVSNVPQILKVEVMHTDEMDMLSRSTLTLFAMLR